MYCSKETPPNSLSDLMANKISKESVTMVHTLWMVMQQGDFQQHVGVRAGGVENTPEDGRDEQDHRSLADSHDGQQHHSEDDAEPVRPDVTQQTLQLW